MKHKKDNKHNAWNANNKLVRPKETSMCDNKVEAALDDSEASNIRDNSDEEKDADSAMKS